MRGVAIRRLGLALAAMTVGLLSACGASVAEKTPRAYAPPPIRHVFVIVLENESYASTFGDPAAYPYLAGALRKRGELLSNYYATGHDSNDNYISLVSGQPPNTANQADCHTFGDFSDNTLLANGVEGGTGCVYPAGVPTIGNQLSARQLSWKGYMEDMGNDPKREAAACGHPALNAPDGTQAAESGDGYATRHDPFVYFHAVIDNAGYCDRHIVALGSPSGAMPAAAVAGETGLVTDLKRAASAPALSFIVPNLCNDGHDYPCANRTSGASAAADIDAFLKTWVPLIRNSPAYGQGGLIEITFDEGADGDSSACCGEAPGPGAAQPGIGGPGGGRVGALLLSPYVKPGSTDARPYNHYSSLASWEQLFGLRRLAYAGTVRNVFGADVYNNYRPRS
jgi:phosphatidylinositol-3-phosphatase